MPNLQIASHQVRGRHIARPHWSYSQISQFLRCPLQYYFERIAKIPRSQNPSGMLLGSMVHEGIAAYHLRLQVGEKATLQELKPAMLSTLLQSEAQRPTIYKPGETRDSLIAQGEALVGLYLNEPPPDKIVAVEQPLLVPLVTSHGEVLEKPLVAVLDLLTEVDNELLITEFKTSARKYSESEVESALQASCYVHAVKERYDRPAKVNYAVLVKTKTPSFQKIAADRNCEALTRIGDIVQTLEKVSQAQAFYPIESPMNCSGCSYRQECRSWTGTNSVSRIMREEPLAC